MSASAGLPPPDVATQPTGQSVAARRPRFALFVATACGLGYIPKAPGTFGSLAGLALFFVPFWSFFAIGTLYIVARHGDAAVGIWSGGHDPLLPTQIAISAAVIAIGVWSASRAANFWVVKDPQAVVIDEVSGQHMTLLLGLNLPMWTHSVTQPSFAGGALMTPGISFYMLAGPSWQYLMLGLILFRVFDIWKPFPVRQAESLPGGWGIMADDWVAAVYAGIGLWIARAAGL